MSVPGLAADPSEVPPRAELIQQAVNGDMVRIINTRPPEPLRWATRLEITRRVLAWVTALAAGVTLCAAFTLAHEMFVLLLAGTVCLALLYLCTWGATIIYAHQSRLALFETYGVAPNRDGVFELIRAAEPHEDLAATREMLRVYAGEPKPIPA